MFDDENDVWPEREQHIFDEKLEREGGVFLEPQHSQRDCNNPDDAGCAPDEYPNDPYTVDNRPGTPDDVTYSFGLELPNAADLHVVPEGGVHQAGQAAPDEERELDPGERDERDMWRRQRSLIEEDETGIRLPDGMTEDDGRRIMGAMGDDQGDEAPEDVADVSATGSTTTEDHGGFPER